jgi:hypothetical protein
MLNRKFPVTMATGGRLKIAKSHYFALFFSTKTDFKVLQLRNELKCPLFWGLEGGGVLLIAKKILDI